MAVLTAVHPIADHWDIIALLLGISNADVKRYHQNNRGDVEEFTKAIIVAWIDLGIASWAMLVSALKHQLVKQVAVANKIAADHPSELEILYNNLIKDTSLQGTLSVLSLLNDPSTIDYLCLNKGHWSPSK